MQRTIEYEDPSRLALITELRKSARVDGANIWSAVAENLSRPARIRREVNILSINKSTKAGETVVVPGKVLGDGTLDHKIVIAAYKYSEKAKKKIEESGGRLISIKELMKENPKGANIRLLG